VYAYRMGSRTLAKPTPWPPHAQCASLPSTCLSSSLLSDVERPQTPAPQPKGSSDTLAKKSNGIFISCCAPHSWIASKSAQVWMTLASSRARFLSSDQMNVIGVISALHCRFWRMMSTQWSRCSIAHNSSLLLQSTSRPYNTWRRRFCAMEEDASA